jgi:hypothetical protein
MFGMIGANPKLGALNSVVYDPDAEAWFTYAGITNVAEKDAFNTFVLSMKATGIWDKILYFNYFSPTSYFAAKSDCISLTTGTEGGTLGSGDWNSTTGEITFGSNKYLKTGKYPNTLGIEVSSAYFMTHVPYNSILFASGIGMGCEQSGTALLWTYYAPIA